MSRWDEPVRPRGARNTLRQSRIMVGVVGSMQRRRRKKASPILAAKVKDRIYQTKTDRRGKQTLNPGFTEIFKQLDYDWASAK